MAGGFAVLTITMPRPLRIQFPGAIYHLMNRGDRREPIFRDESGPPLLPRHPWRNLRQDWMATPRLVSHGQPFSSHRRDPQPNLVLGMKWLLGTYTGRFNPTAGTGSPAISSSSADISGSFR